MQDRTKLKTEQIILAICAFQLIISSCSTYSQANMGLASYQPIESRDIAIPRESYKTWSMILLGNPEWLLPEKAEDLSNLYTRYQLFGNVIGPDHLAVWFSPDAEHEAIDILRCSAYISQLKLPPSESPYLLITTEYPGEGLLSEYPKTFEITENFSIIKLNGLNSGEIVKVLTDLADQLLTQDIESLDPHTENFWRKWQIAYENARNNLTDLFNRIHISINTSFFKIELE